MDDPIQTYDFIKYIIDNREKDIVGVVLTKGDRLTIQKNKSKLEYVISLLLIMGVFAFLMNSFKTVMHKIRRKMSKKLSFILDPTITGYATRKGLKTWQINTPNNQDFLQEIKHLEIDIIINQSQNILKSGLLSIPKIGTLNRHNALLPKNRGRLTPFWVLFKGETETGVSIHFVTEELDAGEIILQERYPITKKDNFNTLVKKNYEIAPIAMLKALDILEKGDAQFISNPRELATYNTTPTLIEAWNYRLRRLNIIKEQEDSL